eukprot:scaffold4320_cov138-Isochrysis_galbana.AAC.1
MSVRSSRRPAGFPRPRAAPLLRALAYSPRRGRMVRDADEEFKRRLDLGLARQAENGREGVNQRAEAGGIEPDRLLQVGKGLPRIVSGG